MSEAMLEDLLARWEDGRRTGAEPAAEELCRGRPELLDDLRRRIHALRAMDRLLDDSGPTLATAGVPDALDGLPELPGYEVLGELGRGGMGVVYKARQVALDRTVAVKMIPAWRAAGGSDEARFRAEAEAVARLAHPNIVAVHEVGRHAGRPYLVLEYVAGGSLAARIAGVPQDPRRAASVVETLARAIHAAHTAGIIHRDLKPANVLLTADGVPKLADFGLAKRLDSSAPGLTGSESALGTPAYMAPEQAAGGSSAVGPAADVYGLGSILYAMLTGRAPFQGSTGLELLQKVVASDPVPPSRLQPGIPADLETICLKCLAKEPAGRYASAAELAADLNRFLEGRTIAARPVGAVGRVWRWARRNPAVAGLMSAVAALLVAVTAVSLAAALRFAEMERRARDLADAQTDARRAAEASAAQAAANAAEAVREKERAEANFELVRRLQAELAESYARLGGAKRAAGQTENAHAFYRKSIELLEQLSRDNPDVPEFRTDLAFTLSNYGVCLINEGDRKQAMERLQQAQTLQVQLADQLPQNARAQIDLAETLRNQVQIRAGGNDAAELVETAARLARCVPLVKPGERIKDAYRQQTKAPPDYADEAVALLRAAAERGFRDAARIRADQRFAPLRDREDFRKLLSDLERPAAPSGG